MTAENHIPEDIIKLDDMRAMMFRLLEVLNHVDHKAIHDPVSDHELQWCIEKGLVEQSEGMRTSGAQFVGPGVSIRPDKPVRSLTSKGHSVSQHLTQLVRELW